MTLHKEKTMRNPISTLAKRLRAALRAYRWRLEDMVDATARMLAESMSRQGSHRMRPIPIRIDERRDTRR
jgi:hypothetical protein